MSDVKDKRNKKNELVARKETLNNLIREHVRNNINKIKRVINTLKELPIQILPNWFELVATSRLDFWIEQLKEISRLQMLKENIYIEEYSNKIRDKDEMYKMITIYNLARDRITFNRKNLKGSFMIECHINLIDGNITVYEMGIRKDYESQIETRVYENINNLITSPFILKVGESDYKIELFNIKMKEIIGLFSDLEKLDEQELNNILTQRYSNSKICLPFMSNDELAKPSILHSMDEFILGYTSSLFSKNHSIKKKAVITNLLVLCLPCLLGRLDISYFQDTEEFYSVHWISDPINKN